MSGGTEADAEAALTSSLEATGFWQGEWIAENTCTVCGASGTSRECNPAGLSQPPLPVSHFTGWFGAPQGGSRLLGLTVPDDDQSQLVLTLGPVDRVALKWSNTSTVVVGECKLVASRLSKLTERWADLGRMSALTGVCTLAEVWLWLYVVSDAYDVFIVVYGGYASCHAATVEL